MSPNLSRPVYKPQLRQFFFLKKEGYYFWKLGNRQLSESCPVVLRQTLVSLTSHCLATVPVRCSGTL